MRITQGTFSFLPDLSDEQIRKQVAYCLDKGWAISIEFTDDPHPRNTFWEMWNRPQFDLKVPTGVMEDLAECRKAYPQHYIKVNAFDSTRTWETTRLSFIVNRPEREPGFGLLRQESDGRSIHYTLHSYATDAPEGGRYSSNGAEPAERRAQPRS